MKIATGLVWCAGFILLKIFLPNAPILHLAWLALLATILLLIPYRTVAT